MSSSAPLTRPVNNSSYETHCSRIFLVQSVFTDTSSLVETPGPVHESQDIIVRLGVIRPDTFRLIVVLSVEAAEGAPFELTVAYAGEFVMPDTVQPRQQEGEWKDIAALVAPGLLYPYVREAISDLTGRWRGDRFVLPLLPLPTFPVEDVTIPPPPSDNGKEANEPTKRRKRTGSRTRPPEDRR